MKRLGLMLEQSRRHEFLIIRSDPAVFLAKRCYGPTPVWYEGEPFTPRRAVEGSRAA